MSCHSNEMTRRTFVQMGALAGLSLPPFLALAQETLGNSGRPGESVREGPIVVVL